jgi:phenylalanine-4-hydroxylase
MKACMTSARAINGLAENIRRTYGVCKFAAVGYSLWTAATVFVLDIKSSRPATDSLWQLEVSRELLNGVAQFCPGIRQAIIALDNQINHLLPDRDRSRNDVAGFVDPSAFFPAVPQSHIPVAPVGEASDLVTDFSQAPDLLSELFHSGFLTQTPFQ